MEFFELAAGRWRPAALLSGIVRLNPASLRRETTSFCSEMSGFTDSKQRRPPVGASWMARFSAWPAMGASTGAIIFPAPAGSLPPR
jgi:hypothetical protein